MRTDGHGFAGAVSMKEREIKVVREVDEPVILVCGPLTDPLHFPDNLFDVCAACGRGIQYRPNAPEAEMRICMACAKPSPEDVLITTETALQEARDYFRRRQ
jgi:hypothetical protein